MSRTVRALPGGAPPPRELPLRTPSADFALDASGLDRKALLGLRARGGPEAAVAVAAADAFIAAVVAAGLRNAVVREAAAALPRADAGAFAKAPGRGVLGLAAAGPLPPAWHAIAAGASSSGSATDEASEGIDGTPVLDSEGGRAGVKAGCCARVS